MRISCTCALIKIMFLFPIPPRGQRYRGVNLPPPQTWFKNWWHSFLEFNRKGRFLTFSASPLHQHTTQRRRNHRVSSAVLPPPPHPLSLSLSLSLSPSLPLSLSLYVTQRRRERVLPHIPYHHATEVKIFARKNFSHQITVKTLKNSLSVVFKTLTLCSYNFWQGAGFESCSVAFLFSFYLSLFCFVFVFVLFAYLFCCWCLLNIYLLEQR